MMHTKLLNKNIIIKMVDSFGVSASPGQVSLTVPHYSASVNDVLHLERSTVHFVVALWH